MKNLGIGLLAQICMLFFLVHASALAVPVFSFRFIFGALPGGDLPRSITTVILLITGSMLYLFMAMLCSGITARFFGLRYEGEHELDASIPEVRKWLLHMAVYLPVAVVLDSFHLYPLKSLHMRLFGARIGKRVIAGGMVTDPCLLSVDDDSVIAGFSIVMGHAVEHGRIGFGRVTIGKRCGVGVRAVVLPGAVLEDGSLVGAQSLVLPGMVVHTGETYLGVPARRVLARKEHD